VPCCPHGFKHPESRDNVVLIVPRGNGNRFSHEAVRSKVEDCVIVLVRKMVLEPARITEIGFEEIIAPYRCCMACREVVHDPCIVPLLDREAGKVRSHVPGTTDHEKSPTPHAKSLLPCEAHEFQRRPAIVTPGAGTGKYFDGPPHFVHHRPAPRKDLIEFSPRFRYPVGNLVVSFVFQETATLSRAPKSLPWCEP